MPQETTRRRWWGNSQERAARRAYRRTLPPLYRWRRVLVGVALAALVGGLLSLLDNNPVTWLKSRWTEWTVDLVRISDVSVTAVPPESVAPTYKVASLTDRDYITAWATRWPEEPQAATQCGASPVGRVKLSWDSSVRVYRIDLRGGLSSKENTRNNQFTPSRVDVQIAGRCEPLALERASGWQELPLDTRAPVSTLTLSVGAVRFNKADPLEPLVAISEVRLMNKPGQ